MSSPPHSSDSSSEESCIHEPSDNLPVPTNKVFPLVSPNLVTRCSKDPNRTLYPLRKQCRRHQPGSSDKSNNFPSFSNAKKLYNDSQIVKNHQMDQSLNSCCSTRSSRSSSGISRQPFFSQNSSETASSSKSIDSNDLEIKSRLRSCKRKKCELETVGSMQKNKISKYCQLTKSHKQSCKASKHHVTDNSYLAKHCESSSSDQIEKTDKIILETEKPFPSGLGNSSLTDTKWNSLGSCSQDGETQSGSNDQNYYFGLFGATNTCEKEDPTGPNYFELLPVHVTESILCQVPFLDLIQCRLVCKAWNEIISNKKFVEWKMIYYKLKYENANNEFLMQGMCESLGLYGVEDCFPVLIKFMANGFSRRPSSDMKVSLKTNPKCVDAESLLLERFPEWTVENLNPWSIIAAAVLLSETVWDVCSIFQSLLSTSSQCSVHDLLDAMYCITTFLLYFKDIYRINHGLHYRVYYALSLFENATPRSVGTGSTSLKVEKGISGQQSIHSYCEPVVQKMTYEQIRILNHRLRPQQVIKIVAFAGTGKTSTLIQFARLYPQLKFLNVMFNKAVCDHASKLFPANVVCRTAHSLAFEAVGKDYRNQLNLKLKPHDVMTHVKKPENMRLHTFCFSKCILRTIECFSASADEEITTAHVPKIYQDAIQCILTDVERTAICKEAREYWKKMIDKTEATCKMTHDVYLKLFQLQHSKYTNYNCIMIDEAQDCNAAMLDIMLSQNLPVILVGDPNQQIYGFRGARNALKSVNATHTYHLTKSFRFGPEIAYVASCCLEVLKCNKRETLIGDSKQSYVNGQSKGQYAIIARSNVSLFNEAVRLCCSNQRQAGEPQKIHGAFAGGISGYGFDQLIDIHRLKQQDPQAGSNNATISDKFIRKFQTFDELKFYSKRTEDADLLGKIELVVQYNNNIPHIVKLIKQKCCYSLELANMIFTTAHKAKGLEFDTVALLDDFCVGKLPQEIPTKDSPLCEEYNILYVALTRAKKCLLLCDKLYKVLVTAQEKFEYPVASIKLLEGSASLNCKHCGDSFVPHTSLVMVRRKTVMANGRVIESGPLCMKCATKPHYRPETHTPPLVMYLDPVDDFAHRSMASLVGPLPSDPPIVHDEIFREIHGLDVIYVVHGN